MKSAVWSALSRFACFACFACLLGCTVAPRLVTPAAPSWDSGRQDSGVIAQLADRSFVVTWNLVARFDSLAKTYGAALTPPRTNAFGVSPMLNATNAFYLTQDAMSAYTLLCILRDSGQAAKPK